MSVNRPTSDQVNGRSTIPAVVLLIEDEEPIRRFLRAGLESHGYRCIDAGTGGEGVAHAATRSPDAILLDLGLPDLDGLTVMKRIREWSSTPIIVLTARSQDRDKVDALDGGADDYVTKPFSMPELLARLRAAMRRHAQAGSDPGASVLQIGPLQIDLARRRVSVDGAQVQLTRIEYQLLVALARHAGRVLTHEFLLREVWGPAYTSQHHYLRVYMAQLRHKIERNPARPRLLKTETGVGYRMADPAEL